MTEFLLLISPFLIGGAYAAGAQWGWNAMGKLIDRYWPVKEPPPAPPMRDVTPPR